MDNIPTPAWVKLIPADAIPVFCFGDDTLDDDLHRASQYLAEFFGERKVLVIRGAVVDIYAIADRADVSAEGASWAMEPRVITGPAHGTERARVWLAWERGLALRVDPDGAYYRVIAYVEKDGAYTAQCVIVGATLADAERAMEGR